MMAVCYTLLTFLPTESMPLIQTAFTSVIVFSGLSTVGVVKSTHLVRTVLDKTCYQKFTRFIGRFFYFLLPFMFSQNERSS